MRNNDDDRGRSLESYEQELETELEIRWPLGWIPVLIVLTIIAIALARVI